MFGHQNSEDNASAPAGAPKADAPVAAHEPTTIAPTASSPTLAPTASIPSPTSAPTARDNDAGSYVMTDLPNAAPSAAPSTPPVTPAPSAPTTAAPAAAATGASAGDLVELKQSALHELSPLIGHLEQSPEEKFRTTMMMIQASDDQSLLPTALAAAKQIKDEKARAQALLDVVNEINYFTQQQDA